MEWMHYWWLLFPLAGMIGAGIKNWSRIAERRSALQHRQKMEELAAQQAWQQQVGARAPQAPLTGESAPPPPVATPSTAQQVARIMAEEDAVTARWLDYELDVAKQIAYPAMSDGRQALTADFLRAKKVADALRPASADAPLHSDDLTAYRNAVSDYAVKFDIAEQDARRLRDSTFTADERKRLDRAQQLLKLAVDESATPAERQVAYKRVREELDGLIVLSDQSVTILESKVGLQLGPSPQVPPSTGTPPA